MSLDRARVKLAKAQLALVQALTGRTTVLADFDKSRWWAAADALLQKRARQVDRAWPSLRRVLDPRFLERFAEFAATATIPGRGGPLADGRGFIRHLEGRDELPAEVRLEAFAVDLRYASVCDGLAPRRLPTIRVGWSSRDRRLVLAVFIPWVGEYCFSLALFPVSSDRTRTPHYLSNRHRDGTDRERGCAGESGGTSFAPPSAARILQFTEEALMATHNHQDKPDRNPDPLTGEPGSHPVGVGLGTTGGALAGAAIGSVAGPAGAVLGGIAGGLTGKGMAEAFDPTIEENYWRLHYQDRPYVKHGSSFDEYAPAYRYGWESQGRYGERSFDEVEADLEREWSGVDATSPVDWVIAREAARDAWNRVKNAGRRN